MTNLIHVASMLVGALGRESVTHIAGLVELRYYWLLGRV